MKRRTFLQASVAAGASMFMPKSQVDRADAASKKSQKPNILYIFTDQQSSSMMSCAGNEYLRTPAMDSLARAGMRFDRAYCTNPVCVPSRMSMATGHYPSEMNVNSNNAKASEVLAHFVRDAMGHLMSQAGYDVGYAGKVHLPGPLKLDKIGFDNYLTKDQRDECATAAARFVKARRDKPFFLVASFINPHDICYMAIRDKVVSSFDKALIRNGHLPIGRLDEALERPEGVSDEKFWNELCPPLPPNHEPLTDEPEAIGKLLSRRPFRVNARENWTDEMWRLHRWAYARLTERVDAQIGRLLQALRESGQEENTVVIFSSDHGDNDASRKAEHKTLPYDEAAGIPFIVSQKGTTRVGVDGTHLVSNGLDLIPTLCDYAGIGKPAHMQGRSVRALAEGRDDDRWRNELMVQCEIGRAVMMGSYKYIRFDEGANDEQLFDLSSDPHEVTTRIDDAVLSDVLARLRKALSRQVHGIDDRFGQAYVPRL